jgi:GntR family transcriptional regulator, trigonelline degradation regulator
MSGVDVVTDPFNFTRSTTNPLLKETLAKDLRELIVRGELRPGEPIVEAKWAAKFGVAQASIREAINILIGEGFVQKGAGRSARVILFGEQELAQIYQVRSALEALAAGLIAESRQDLGDLDQILREMDEAASRGEVENTLWKDLAFHMRLCEKAGNPFLFDHAKRLILPLFAFMAIRTMSDRIGPQGWLSEMQQHQQIVESIRSGDPFFASQYTLRAIRQFGAEAREEWAHDSESK